MHQQLGFIRNRSTSQSGALAISVSKDWKLQ
jgi:hypothetical protein